MHRTQHLLIIAGDAVPTAATSCMDKFVGFIVGVISHCRSRRALVQRWLCLKRLTISFPTSSIIAILFFYFVLFFGFCGRCTAGASPQPHQNFSWRLRFCCLVVNAKLLRLCGSRWRKLRSSHEVLRDLLAILALQKRTLTSQSKWIKSSNPPQQIRTLGSKSSSKCQTQGLLELGGDR